VYFSITPPPRPDVLCYLSQWCWHPHPEGRPTAQQVLQWLHAPHLLERNRSTKYQGAPSMAVALADRVSMLRRQTHAAVEEAAGGNGSPPWTSDEPWGPQQEVLRRESHARSPSPLIRLREPLQSPSMKHLEEGGQVTHLGVAGQPRRSLRNRHRGSLLRFTDTAIRTMSTVQESRECEVHDYTKSTFTLTTLLRPGSSVLVNKDGGSIRDSAGDGNTDSGHGVIYTGDNIADGSSSCDGDGGWGERTAHPCVASEKDGATGPVAGSRPSHSTVVAGGCLHGNDETVL